MHILCDFKLLFLFEQFVLAWKKMSEREGEGEMNNQSYKKYLRVMRVVPLLIHSRKAITQVRQRER